MTILEENDITWDEPPSPKERKRRGKKSKFAKVALLLAENPMKWAVVEKYEKEGAARRTIWAAQKKIGGFNVDGVNFEAVVSPEETGEYDDEGKPKYLWKAYVRAIPIEEEEMPDKDVPSQVIKPDVPAEDTDNPSFPNPAPYGHADYSDEEQDTPEVDAEEDQE